MYMLITNNVIKNVSKYITLHKCDKILNVYCGLYQNDHQWVNTTRELIICIQFFHSFPNYATIMGYPLMIAVIQDFNLFPFCLYHLNNKVQHTIKKACKYISSDLGSFINQTFIFWGGLFDQAAMSYILIQVNRRPHIIVAGWHGRFFNCWRGRFIQIWWRGWISRW